MADLTTSGVVVNRSWSTTLSNGSVLYSKACTVTLTAMGTTTNRILASAFGLSSFEKTSNFTKTDDAEILPAGIGNARTTILLQDTANAADTVARLAPKDYSGAYNCVVEGY